MLPLSENKELDTECIVCFEEIPGGREDVRAYMPCAHLVCAACFLACITSQHLKKGVTDIQCPQCSRHVDDTVVRRFLAKQVGGESVLKWLDELCVRQAYPSGCEERLVMCPGDGGYCGYAAVTGPCDGERAKAVPCINEQCTVSSFCSLCQALWSSNAREQHKCDAEAGENTTAFPRLVRVQCPKCRSRIDDLHQQTNFIYHAACDTKFCYLCNRIIVGVDHFYSLSGCFLQSQYCWNTWTTWLVRTLLFLFSPVIALLLVMALLPAVICSSPAMIYIMYTESCLLMSGNIINLTMKSLLIMVLVPLVAVSFVLIAVIIFLAYIYLYIPLTCMGFGIFEYLSKKHG